MWSFNVEITGGSDGTRNEKQKFKISSRFSHYWLTSAEYRLLIHYQLYPIIHNFHHFLVTVWSQILR